MNILVDITHPAHLHFFRNVITRLQNEGHKVKLTGREKDILVELAQNYGMEMEIFGIACKGMLNLGSELLFRQWRLRKIVREFKPDVMMAVAGTYMSMVGRLMQIPVYVFYDTEDATLSNLLAYPFATCIYVPRCYRKHIRWRHVRYNGYHELAYLHPAYFKPDPDVLHEVGLKHGELFTILRFIGWGASHDIGRAGFTHSNKLRLVEAMSRYGRIFISCEGELPKELEEYRLRLNIAHIHDLMAYSALIFGESLTMCSEGAVLGVPGVCVNHLNAGTINEQEHEYGLVFKFTPNRQEQAIQKAVEILSNYRTEEWRMKGRRLVEEKIDVTEMIYQVALERPFS